MCQMQTWNMWLMDDVALNVAEEVDCPFTVEDDVIDLLCL